MRLLFIPLCIFGLSGCVYQELENTDIRKAVYFCKGYKNIAELTETFFGSGSVKCTNGDYSMLYKVSLPLEQ